MHLLFYFASFFSFQKDTIPAVALKLIQHYPGIVVAYKDNRLFFKDGSSLLYNDKKIKSAAELMASPDIEDQFTFKYITGNLAGLPNNDAGRIRNEQFFKKVYGSTAAAVNKNLVQVIWCPKSINQKIWVTKINEVNKAIEAVSAALDELPHFKKYISKIGGSFNWRFISGTNRLSMHSFGMTLDINTQHANYWQWDCNCTNENARLTYRNKIPQQIVDIFEKHGFIWGGKWYHYDTMHFEYRPELIN